MEIFTLTTPDKLKAGDTFYKEKDASKITYTMLPLKCRTPGQFYVRKAELKFTDIIDYKEPVIFLKHKIIGVTIKKINV